MLSGLRRVWRECEVVRWFLVKVASPDKQEEHKTTSPLKKKCTCKNYFKMQSKDLEGRF